MKKKIGLFGLVCCVLACSAMAQTRNLKGIGLVPNDWLFWQRFQFRECLT